LLFWWIIIFSATYLKSLAQEKSSEQERHRKSLWYWFFVLSILKLMEKGCSSSPRTGLLSCWGCLKLKLPWRIKRPCSYKPVGGFGYDPLSYAQNFDDGCMDDDEEDSSRRRFSARYAAPSTSTKPLNQG